MLTTTFRF